MVTVTVRVMVQVKVKVNVKVKAKSNANAKRYHPNANSGLLQLGAYTSPTLNLRPKKLNLRKGVVYEFEVTVRAGPGNAADANSRLGLG